MLGVMLEVIVLNVVLEGMSGMAAGVRYRSRCQQLLAGVRYGSTYALGAPVSGSGGG
jgi:hypothetical protein